MKALRSRPGRSKWVDSLERLTGPTHEDRRRLRRENKRRLREEKDDFVPYSRGMHYGNHPDW